MQRDLRKVRAQLKNRRGAGHVQKYRGCWNVGDKAAVDYFAACDLLEFCDQADGMFRQLAKLGMVFE